MRILTYGTFDTLHFGHIRLLKRARAMGDHLTVALSTDEFNALKGKKAKFSWKQRKQDLEAIQYVDEVIPESSWKQKIDDVKKHNIDVFVIGDDWEGKFDFLKEHCEVVYLDRTADISSTMIRKISTSSPSSPEQNSKAESMKEQNQRVLEIHKIAFSEFKKPQKNLQTRRLFVELKELKSNPPTKEWLEAATLVSIFRLARPRNTVGFLNQLRSMAGTPGEIKQFDAFHNDVDEYLKPLIVTNHGYIEEPFGKVTHEEIWKDVAERMNQLKDAGHKVFLNPGALLGLVREGTLIEHDNDIDLGIILDADSEVSAVKAWKALPQQMRDLGIFVEGSDQYNGFIRIKPAAGYDVEIFPGWVENGKVYIYPHTNGELTKEDVLPFSMCPVSGLDRPAEPEKMLAINYGEDWRTPDPLFKFRKPPYFKNFLAASKAK